MRVTTGRLFRRPRSRFWWVAFYAPVRGRRVEVRLSSKTEDYRQAARFLKAQMARYELGGHRGAPYLRFQDLWDGLLADYEMRRRKTPPRTLRARYVHLDGFFRDFRAADITTAQVRRYMAQRRDEGASSATINRECAALARAFGLAIERGELTLADRPAFSRLPEGPARQGYLEPGAFERLVAGMPEYLRAPATFMYWTGWRLGEVFGLRWADVNLEAKQLFLPASHDKIGAGRWIPYATFAGVVRALEGAWRMRVPGCVYVFHRRGRHIRDIRTAWDSALERAGQERVTPHDLRRSAATNLALAGVAEQVAMQILGHRTPGTYRRYRIGQAEDMLQAGAGLTAYLQKPTAAPGTSGN